MKGAEGNKLKIRSIVIGRLQAVGLEAFGHEARRFAPGPEAVGTTDEIHEPVFLPFAFLSVMEQTCSATGDISSASASWSRFVLIDNTAGISQI
jgi:hypothetical protein